MSRFLPGGGREPIYLEDLLVEVWRFYSVGCEDRARDLLVQVWSWSMDGLSSEQEARVALRLFQRLAPCTDDPDGWASLPGELVVYRAGGPGISWTLSREIAEQLAAAHELEPVRAGRVAKSDVLAYITHHGEEEIIAMPERIEHATP